MGMLRLRRYVTIGIKCDETLIFEGEYLSFSVSCCCGRYQRAPTTFFEERKRSLAVRGFEIPELTNLEIVVQSIIDEKVNTFSL
jgi:hypothetical protein